MADFTVFSFHAVKNLTTAEGGAVTFNAAGNISVDEIYNKFQLLSLHGQSKDALAKMKAGGWKYSIELPGYKFNMTDLQAAIGLAQLKRYDMELLPARKRLHHLYLNLLGTDSRLELPSFETPDKIPSYHIFPVRIKNCDEQIRDEIIRKLAEAGISANVHYIPVVMHPAYAKLGYHIQNYPNVFDMYRNEVTLPLYSSLKEDDVETICSSLNKILNESS